MSLDKVNVRYSITTGKEVITFSSLNEIRNSTVRISLEKSLLDLMKSVRVAAVNHHLAEKGIKNQIDVSTTLVNKEKPNHYSG
ncbi:hypothetical protein [Alteribacter keqinensis]|uniref:Uncharacterized protein n=1 Tax=Alteribacter keqinensis TaxID=2483800 RepID=A0A3M7TUY9_9BACI|nr:hypothetical protein [Alteribacter keqinensis]RNA68544.1 hypothetical protein EBO34_00805 [Alteribacter keqinensis]